MDTSKATAIDLVEAAYDLEVGAGSWLRNLLERGGSALNLGMGCAGAIWAGASREGHPLITQMHVHAGPQDLALRFARAAREMRPEIAEQTVEGPAAGVRTACEALEHRPHVYEALTTHVGCQDVLGVWALDPDLHGVGINVPCAERLRLSRRARQYWQTLAVHIGAGHRLRRGLGLVSREPGIPAPDLPLEAEALIDPTRFSISHAVGEAASKTSCETIREAAVQIDCARGSLRKNDPERALELWQGLVRGRWSLIDWFDTDGRRFVLARPNEPSTADPRGMTKREREVLSYAALGETNKITGYRLGISPTRVSVLLHSAMRKLGVRTQAQLVMKVQGLEGRPHDA